jgi:hypothetical protein
VAILSFLAGGAAAGAALRLAGLLGGGSLGFLGHFLGFCFLTPEARDGLEGLNIVSRTRRRPPKKGGSFFFSRRKKVQARIPQKNLFIFFVFHKLNFLFSKKKYTCIFVFNARRRKSRMRGHRWAL